MKFSGQDEYVRDTSTQHNILAVLISCTDAYNSVILIVVIRSKNVFIPFGRFELTETPILTFSSGDFNNQVL